MARPLTPAAIAAGLARLPSVARARTFHVDPPRLAAVRVQSSAGWRPRGLHLHLAHAPVYTRRTIERVERHSFRGPAWDVMVNHGLVESVAGASGWSAADSSAKAGSGVEASGPGITIS